MPRPLTGIVIGISISGAEDLASRGLTEADVNGITVELCRRFVALGAQIVLGHQWRPRGIMEAVARFAQAYQSESPQPIIHNFLAWPDRAALAEKDRKKVRKLVAVYEQESAPESDRSDPRVGALRHMRQLMAAKNDARICLSGDARQRPGFVPGVIEEAALTLLHGKPLYLSRMMGGTASRLIDVVRKKRTVDDAFPDDMPREYRDCFTSLEASALGISCGLSIAELNELFDAENLDTIVQLTSRGLLQRFGFSRG